MYHLCIITLDIKDIIALNIQFLYNSEYYVFMMLASYYYFRIVRTK